MLAAALLCCAFQGPAPAVPVADADWVAGLPELLPPGTAFRYQPPYDSDGAGTVLLVFSAAEASAKREELNALEAERESAAEGRGVEIQRRIDLGRLSVVQACGNGRLSFRTRALDFAAEADLPVVSHVPLSGIAGVMETEARYAERTGTTLPPRDFAPEPPPADGGGAGD